VRARERLLRRAPCAPCVQELVEASSFTFGIDGAPPAELLFLLWCVLAIPSGAPEWMAEASIGSDAARGTSRTCTEDAIMAARSFMGASSPAWQLQPPTPTIVPLRLVLTSAIEAHSRGYALTANAAAANGGSCEAPGNDAGFIANPRAAHASEIVFGELRIWRKAMEMLAMPSTGVKRKPARARSERPVEHAVERCEVIGSAKRTWKRIRS
jgi:hypothetical protein